MSKKKAPPKSVEVYVHPSLTHWGKSRGRNLYSKFLDGEVLTRGEAIIAKCADCQGGYVDGRFDCGCEDCPLYDYMPYQGKFPKGEEEEGK